MSQSQTGKKKSLDVVATLLMPVSSRLWDWQIWKVGEIRILSSLAPSPPANQSRLLNATDQVASAQCTSAALSPSRFQGAPTCTGLQKPTPISVWRIDDGIQMKLIVAQPPPPPPSASRPRALGRLRREPGLTFFSLSLPDTIYPFATGILTGCD